MDSTGHIILPEPTLRRLPWYLAYVDTLEQRKVQNVSSTTISKALNVDSSQIAKDLSLLNLKGKTRIGYNVSAMRKALSAFLGFKDSHGAFLLGAGSLGAALINDTGLSNYGLNILAAFDCNPDLIGKEVGGVHIYDINDLPEMQKKTPAKIAIITVPAENAQDVADIAIEAGIKALWNFTPYRVLVPEDIVVSSTCIYANLALIYNRLKNADQSQGFCDGNP